jgi:hypothetical protein
MLKPPDAYITSVQRRFTNRAALQASKNLTDRSMTLQIQLVRESTTLQLM